MKSSGKEFSLLALIAWIILPQLVGFIGSIFTISAIPLWYETLVQPSFRPPNWLFAPVWTVLYFFMGIAAYRVWSRGIKQSKIRTAMVLFLIQLALNALWSILFFGLRSPGIAFGEIVLLWSFIFITMLHFWRIDKLAGYLFIPYSMWVAFAMVLNASIWYLNR